MVISVDATHIKIKPKPDRNLASILFLASLFLDFSLPPQEGKGETTQAKQALME